MKASSYRVDVSRTVPTEIRVQIGKKRNYWLIQNRSTGTIYMSYDTPAANDGSQGIEIVSFAGYELYGEFAPENETIYLTGTQAALQAVILSEGYYEDQNALQDYALDHA